MSREAVVNRLMKIQADLAPLKWMDSTNVNLSI